MSETYFQNFKQIQYSNNSVIDITERVVTLSNVEKNPYIFYPLDITNGVRADQIANLNYKDPYASWVIYLNNDIVDPYYEWYMTQEQFNAFITTKYGSMANAMRKIAFWRNDWVDKPTINIGTYLAEIARNPILLKYWEPTYNNVGNINGYQRKKDDWIVTTNKIVQYTLEQPISFIEGEVINIVSDSLNPLLRGAANFPDISHGKASVVKQQGNQLIINNPITYDNLTFGGTGTITGTESNVILKYTSVEVLSDLISNDEIAYWSPVYYYDMENEKNEGNRTVRVMQPTYIPRFIDNVKNLLDQ